MMIGSARGMAWSAEPITAQDGIVFQAGPPDPAPQLDDRAG
jgi:hypothetical protein